VGLQSITILRGSVRIMQGPRADHDRAGPEYRYLDWYATANTDYVNYGTKDIQVLHYGI
jgi:hypothetical protein